MKRKSDSSHSVKSQESGELHRQNKFITFDYSNSIRCFISTAQHKLHCSLSPSHSRCTPDRSPSISFKHTQKKEISLQVPRKNKGKMTINNQQTFNNKILLLEYQREEDCKSEEKVEAKERSKDSSKSEEEDQAVNAVVNSCLMVITEDTEPSSNPPSGRCPQNTEINLANQETGMQMAMQNQMLPIMSMVPMYQIMPMPMQMQMQMQYYYQAQMSLQADYERNYAVRQPAPRNRKTVSTEQSAMFIVDPEKVISDGRTTVMIRNIPNKYTQQMLLSLFRRDHNRKFDFFYLPIDYSNKCNVGYAFINFVHTKFIIDFYEDFHQRRWQKFNSDKICQVCYARIQGTAQLQNHFINSNVIQQKDKRYRPLIGVDFFDEAIGATQEENQNQK